MKTCFIGSSTYGLRCLGVLIDDSRCDLILAITSPVNLKLNNLANTLKINKNESDDKKMIILKKINGKQILSDMIKKFIPIKVTNDEKKCFSSPDASWFKKDSREFTEKNLLSKKKSIFSYLNYEAIEVIAKEQLDG